MSYVELVAMVTLLPRRVAKSVSVMDTPMSQLGFVTQQRVSVIVRMKRKETSVNLVSPVTMAIHVKEAHVIDNALPAASSLPLRMEAWAVTQHRIVAISTATPRTNWKSRTVFGCSIRTAQSGESPVDWELTELKLKNPLFS